MRKRNRKGQGTLYRRSRNGREYGSWLAKFTVDGNAVQINTHTTDYDEAERVFTQHRKRLKAGQMAPDRLGLTVSAYADHFIEDRLSLVARGRIKRSTYVKYKQAIDTFVSFIRSVKPTMKMDEVTTSTIEAYMTHRAKQTRCGKGNVAITKVGVNKSVSFIRTFFRRACRKGVILANPINENLTWFNVRRTRTREHLADEIFTDEEVSLILEELRRGCPRAFPFVAAIAMTGARRAEVAHLRRENVDFHRSLLHIEPDPETGWSPKNEASIRAVPMWPELRDIMQDLINRNDHSEHGYVFSLPDGRPLWTWQDFPLRRMQSAIRRLNKNGHEVRHGHLRMLRHWFISHSLNRRDDPINPAEMMQIVGHTDLTMICKVYYHADLARISEKMDSFRVLKGGYRREENKPSASRGDCAAPPEE